MPMYWADYLADTMHLTTEEHGAYLLLIGIYWRRGKALPDDNRWLANATKISLRRFKSVRVSISPFFEISDGVWKHKRIEKEILRSSERLKSARANGQAGGLAKSQRAGKLITVTSTEELPLISPSGGNRPINFERWWNEYPRKIGRLKVQTVYERIVKKGLATEAELLDGLRRYIDAKPITQDWCHPTTWLNQGRWLDKENPGGMQIAQMDADRPLTPAEQAIKDRLIRERAMGGTA